MTSRTKFMFKNFTSAAHSPISWVSFITSILLLSSISSFGQIERNRRPKIVGQEQLTTNEEGPITVRLNDLKVEDRDDFFYPLGFSMKLYPGTNYTLSDNTVIPAPDFSGNLRVPVTVNDGEEDSDSYDLLITVNPVNDHPRITGQTSVVGYQGKPITIEFVHLTVSDPDNAYPGGFSLTIYPGENYTVSGNQVTPGVGFSGTLSVKVTVSDGTASSEAFTMSIQVINASEVPEIVGQVPLSMNEDESLHILISYLNVVDTDTNYPEGFALRVQNGANYSVANNVITPAVNFNGKLTAGVVVSDGKHISKVFDLIVVVLPVNDPPAITKLETQVLNYQTGRGLIPISNTIEIDEPDGDELVLAEIRFKPETFKMGEDELAFVDTANIQGVFDATRGVMTLSGKASASSYTMAIRSVKYQNAKITDASRETRKLTITVSDGIVTSLPGERIIAYGKTIGDLDVPSGFTPNGDHANDTWIITPLRNGDEYNAAVVRVYTKHGKLVYETTGFNKPWDGRFDGELLPADIYYFTIDIDPLSFARSPMKGVVTILR